MKEFEYVDFVHCVKGSSLDGKAKMMYKPNGKYHVRLNKDVSNDIVKAEAYYVRLRRNVITGEVFFIFQQEQTPDSVKVYLEYRGKCIIISCRGFVEAVGKLLGIPSSELDGHLLTVGENKSRMDDIVCVQVWKGVTSDSAL